MLYRLTKLRYQAWEAQIRCFFSPTGLIPLPASSCDIVISSHVIEHVPDQASYMAELVRVLTPGGVAFFLCPNRWWPFEPHGKFPMLPYLPKALGTIVCQWLQRAVTMGQQSGMPGCTKDLFHRLNASIMVKHFMSPRTLKRLVSHAGLVPRVCNPPERLADLAPRISRFLRRVPLLYRLAAYALSREIFLVSDKPWSPKIFMPKRGGLLCVL